MEEERERLYKVESLEILEYVKQSVEILMNMKGDEFDVYQKNKEFNEKVKKKDEERLIKEKEEQTEGENKHGRNIAANRFIINTSVFSSGAFGSPQSARSIPIDYEKIIQKLEADIRNHIRVEQQLKLHIESIQS
jgi:hypothetical protein